MLASRITRALLRPAVLPGEFERVEVAVEGLEPLSWLRAQRDTTQYYWCDRDSDFEVAGIGEADVLMPPDGPEDHAALFRVMRERLSERYPAQRYYGGFRFRAGAPGEGRWKNFRAYRFVVPRIEVMRRRSGVVIACNVRTGSVEENEAELARALAAIMSTRWAADDAAAARLPRVTARSDSPDRGGWDALIADALAQFQAGRMQKVVLARETCFAMEAPTNPIELLNRLISGAPRSFVFCFQPSADRAFIGASPELLFRRKNVYVQSEALAGTRARGKTDEEDEALADELLRSEKERREHRFVVDMLRERLSRLCAGIEMPDEPRIKRLRHVQHLYTAIQGILHDKDADATLLALLHPTPAVGGEPRAAALAWLEAHEPFDRGIFAAPTGWVGFDEAVFCVAIRSGLLRGDTLAVYTGAGIVPGSVAEEEWNEIEAKMAPFLDALGLEHG